MIRRGCFHRRRRALLFVALACAWFAPAGAHEGEPPPPPAGAAIVHLSLAPGGVKWPTDPPLRAAMAGIRAAYAAEEGVIDQIIASDEVFERVATRVDEGVYYLVSNSHLAADAEASLHYLVADMLRGANLMHGKDPSATPHDGARFLHAALHAYGTYFDDPDWAGR